jgi:hypothetical protein
MRELNENELRSVEGGKDLLATWWEDTKDDLQDIGEATLEGLKDGFVAGVISGGGAGSIAVGVTTGLTSGMVSMMYETSCEIAEDVGLVPMD